VSQRTRPPIPGFVNRVDAERDAVGKQCIATVRIEGGERVPEVARLARQLLGPAPVLLVDGFGDSGVIETRRLAAEDDTFRVNVETGLGRIKGMSRD